MSSSSEIASLLGLANDRFRNFCLLTNPEQILSNRHGTDIDVVAEGHSAADILKFIQNLPESQFFVTSVWPLAFRDNVLLSITSMSTKTTLQLDFALSQRGLSRWGVPLLKPSGINEELRTRCLNIRNQRTYDGLKKASHRVPTSSYDRVRKLLAPGGVAISTSVSGLANEAHGLFPMTPVMATGRADLRWRWWPRLVVLTPELMSLTERVTLDLVAPIVSLSHLIGELHGHFARRMVEVHRLPGLDAA